MRRLIVILALVVGILLHATAPAQSQGDSRITPVDRFMRAAKGVNLRSGPGTHYDRVGGLRVGETVWVTGEVTGDWLRIVTRSGRIGFVYAPLLTEVPRRPDSVDGSRPVGSLEAAHRAVWRIHNLRPGESFGGRQGHSRGTAFAIGRREFVTALHVLLGLLGGVDDLASIRLGQEGNPVELRVSRVLAINVAHDLAYLETRERVADYLSPVYEGGLPLEAYEGTDHLGNKLTLLGYLDESLVRQEASEGIIYEDVYGYSIATAYPDLHGMSGSPIVNSDGRFVGVVVSAQHNVVESVKIGYVAQLLSGGSGVRCFDFSSLEACLVEGVRTVEAMAEQGDVLSLYAMGSEHGEMRDIDPRFVLSMDALRKAADMGFPSAEFELGVFLDSQGRKEEAFAWVRRSAMKDYPAAVYNLGRAYSVGYGTGKNEELGNMWLEKSRRQGFVPGE